MINIFGIRGKPWPACVFGYMFLPFYVFYISSLRDFVQQYTLFSTNILTLTGQNGTGFMLKVLIWAWISIEGTNEFICFYIRGFMKYTFPALYCQHYLYVCLGKFIYHFRVFIFRPYRTLFNNAHYFSTNILPLTGQNGTGFMLKVPIWAWISIEGTNEFICFCIRGFMKYTFPTLYCQHYLYVCLGKFIYHFRVFIFRPYRTLFNNAHYFSTNILPLTGNDETRPVREGILVEKPICSWIKCRQVRHNQHLQV